MNNIIEGKFEGIQEKTGSSARGPWTMYSALVSGKRYNAGFSKAIFSGLEIGDYVRLELIQAGKYLNLSKIEKINENRPNQTQTTTSSSASSVPEQSDSERFKPVSRRECLGHAASFVNGQADHPLSKRNPSAVERMKKAVALAEHLVKWTETGLLEEISQDEVKVKETLQPESPSDEVGV